MEKERIKGYWTPDAAGSCLLAEDKLTAHYLLSTEQPHISLRSWQRPKSDKYKT